MKHNISLELGWNCVEFDHEINMSELISNRNIVEIKSALKSYNRNVEDKFNTLKKLEKDTIYWIRTEDFKLFDTEITYDVVIVGAGPAGCMLTRVLQDSEKFKDKKILLIEKGGDDILENYEEKYRDLTKWNDAMNDPLNSYSLNDENTRFKNIWLGQGLGGGTLHFGMQYIDQSGYLIIFLSKILLGRS